MVSDDFSSAFLGYGSMVSADCSCGGVHFCDPKISHGDYEENEYEGYKELQKENPKKYIESNDGCITGFEFGNEHIVWDCPCGRDEEIERTLWRERNSILDFYRSKFIKMQREYFEFSNMIKETDFESDEKLTYVEFLNKLREKKLTDILS